MPGVFTAPSTETGWLLYSETVTLTCGSRTYFPSFFVNSVSNWLTLNPAALSLPTSGKSTLPERSIRAFLPSISSTSNARTVISSSGPSRYADFVSAEPLIFSFEFCAETALRAESQKHTTTKPQTTTASHRRTLNLKYRFTITSYLTHKHVGWRLLPSFATPVPSFLYRKVAWCLRSRFIPSSIPRTPITCTFNQNRVDLC